MAAFSYKLERAMLLIGDVAFFYIALYATLFVRYSGLPADALVREHLAAFSLLFIAWVIVFYIAGLYDRQATLLQRRLPALILKAQIINVTIAAVFFFLAPLFSIAPKTNLVIYLIISFFLIFWYRVYLWPLVRIRRRQPVLLVAEGQEADELAQEFSEHPSHHMVVGAHIRPTHSDSETLITEVDAARSRYEADIIILDLHNPVVRDAAPRLFELVFDGVRFVGLHRLYEDTFDRIPVSLLGSAWSLEHLWPHTKLVHDTIKRGVDIIASFLLGVVTLVLTPLVALAIKLDDGGPVFIAQRRVGQFNRPITVYKFRSMRKSEEGVWVGETENVITRVGHFLRATRIDELPQLWNIFRGDLSLIGPRTDVEALAARLAESIPYYSVRYLVKPGVTGWAQVKQDIVPNSIEETKERLAYDLYYLKYRSLLLDFLIALRTIKTVLSRAGK